MNSASRLSTGVHGLDERLGGGLIPGTLTVVVGATGIGKTQLGLQFLRAGQDQEGREGVVFDMSARIDSQNHAAYAARMFGWELVNHPHESFSAAEFFDAKRAMGNYLHVFEHSGRRVTEREIGFDAWHDWQAELARKLETTLDFLYGNFVRGARRVVIDGIEPVARPSDSIQFELFEYVYHQVLRKDSAWVARDLFRQSYREHAATIDSNAYDFPAIGAVLLSTSHETMLDAIIQRPLVDGDVLATANTLIYMGKVRDGDRLARGLFIAKHRGSACSDDIHRYLIDDHGIRLAY
ncbi:MAG TPA: ATPase domain-containing protein [Pirellulales bacterium]|nr:ATPase domain-containing protein [Pirellulales bacterium]